MKRTSIKIDSVNGSTAGYSPMPRYGGEVLFQSTSDIQNLTLLTNEIWSNPINDEKITQTKKQPYTTFDPSIPFKIFIVILSGCLSSIPFEMIMRLDIGSGLFSAFFLHIYTVVIGLPKAYKDGYIVHSKLPISWHFMLVGLSFLFIVFKTAAVENMPMPLFIVGSNLQLAAGVVIGHFMDGHRYSIFQLFAVLCVILGCIIVTLDGDSFVSSKGIMNSLFGLFCITTAVSILSFLVSASNIAVKKFEADALEQMFRQHLFSLPLFALKWQAIAPRFEIWSNSHTLFTIFSWNVPILYVLLLCTTVFAQINRYMSTNLAIETGPLESQIVCAATKTIVLLVSLLYFNAPPYPSIRIWGGVFLQLFGSLLYARLTSSINEKEYSLTLLSKLRYGGTTDEESGTDNENIRQPPSPNKSKFSSNDLKRNISSSNLLEVKI